MISRRGLLGATLAGIPVGVAGGLLGRSWIRGPASIRFLGQHEAMIALLDTGTTRALFLLGEPDAKLLANMAQLRTFGRSRVDLLVGSHHWLTAAGLRSALDLHRIATISLQASASVPPIRGKVIPVTDQQRLELGGGCEVLLELSTLDPDEPTNPGVHVGLVCNGTRIDMAGSAASLREEVGPALLAVPGEVESDLLMRVGASLFVGTELPRNYDGSTLLAHADDPLTFTIKAGAITT